MSIRCAVGLRSVVIALVVVCGFGVGNLAAAPPSFSGSGFVVHPEGYVVTVTKAVDFSSERMKLEDSFCEVVLGETSYTAQVISQDKSSGLALLRIDATDLPWLPLAKAAAVELGTDVRGFGYPDVWVPDRSADLTGGMVSRVAADSILVDADTKSGNAGGPFVNLRGEVVGLIGADDKPQTISVQAIRALMEQAQVTLPPSADEKEMSTVELARKVAPAVAYVRTLARRVALQTHPSDLEAPLATEPVVPLGFLQNGQVLVTSGEEEVDPTVKLWSVNSGRLLGRYGTKEAELAGAAVCTQKELLVLLEEEGKMTVLSGGRMIHAWRAQTENEFLLWNGIAISADGSTVAASDLERIRIWNLDGTSRREMRLPDYFPRWALSPNGKLIAISVPIKQSEEKLAPEYRVQLFDTNEGRVVRSFQIDPASGLQFSPDGRLLASTSSPEFWDVQTGSRVLMRGDSLGDHFALAMNGPWYVTAGGSHPEKTMDGSFVELWDRDRRIRMLQMEMEAPATEFGTHHPSALAVSPDGLTVATGHKNGLVRLWFAHSLIEELPHVTTLTGHDEQAEYANIAAAYGSGVRLSADGATIASYTRDLSQPTSAAVLISDVPNLVVRQRLDTAILRHLEIAFSFDGTHIAVGTDARGNRESIPITVRRTDTWEPVATLHFHENYLGSLELSRNGEHLFAKAYTFSKDPGGFAVWNVKTGECLPPLRNLKGDEVNVIVLRFSPTGESFLTVDATNKVAIWSATTREIRHALDLQEHNLPSLWPAVCYSYDGSLVALEVEEGILLFNAESGKLEGHLQASHDVGLLCFSPPGDRLAAVVGFPYTKALQVWSIPDGTLQQNLTTGTQGIHIEDLVISGDGRRLIAGAEGCTLRTFPLGYTPRPSVVVEGYLSRAAERASAGNIDEALADYGQAVAHAPSRAATYLARARLLQQKSEFAAADADLTAALHLAPWHEKALGQRAEVRQEAQRYEESLADYDLLLTLHPHQPYVHIERGKCHEALEHYGEAIEDYGTAMKRLPPPLRTEAYFRRGLCYQHTAQWNESIADLQKVLPSLPADAKAEVQAAIAKAQQEAPPAERQAIAQDTCLLFVDTVEGAAVLVDGEDHGARRDFTYPDLEPGHRYTSQIRIKFPGGGEAQRLAILQGGRRVRVRATQPTRIAFSFQRGPKEQFQVYTVHPDGSDFRQIVRSNSNDYSPVISPDGSHIAFLRRQERLDLFVVKASGAPERQVGSDVSGCPAWAPDGRRIAFPSGYKSNVAIHIADLDEVGTRRLAAGQAPSWSPDGSRIAFHTHARKESDAKIMLIDESGENLSNLTNGCYPRWSPEGSQVAFVESDALCVIDVDGRNRTRLAEDAWFGYYQWSPDGERVAFLGEDEDLHVINRDGSGMRTVFRKGAQQSQPDPALWVDDMDDPENLLAWSPDGTRLAFVCTNQDWWNMKVSQYPDASFIYAVNAGGSGLKPVVRYKGYAIYPSWR